MTVDEDLTAARAGDQEAFGRLVSRHRRELVAHCYRMLGSPQDAEDALQETLLAAWCGLSGFAGRSSLRTWLYRVATSVCLRQARRRPRLLSPEAGPPRSDVTDLGDPSLDRSGWDPSRITWWTTRTRPRPSCAARAWSSRSWPHCSTCPPPSVRCCSSARCSGTARPRPRPSWTPPRPR